MSEFGLPQDGTTYTLLATDTAGTFSAGEVTLPAGTNIVLTGDLTIVGLTRIDIAGKILLPKQVVPGARPPNLSILCLRGNIDVAAGTSIGFGQAAPAADLGTTGLPACSRAQPGPNGGHIRFYGHTVNIDGDVYGTDGGTGGRATTDNSAPAPWQRLLNAIPLLAGRASAAGGIGGYGGAVVFCVVERLRLGKTVSAGSGGKGGFAHAKSDNGTTGYSRGGHGGQGGNVIISKAGGGGVLEVFIDSDVKGGRGGDGGMSFCDGCNALRKSRGKAAAWGGNGGKGGTVIFNNCSVLGMGTVLEGAGGAADQALANAGDGADHAVIGETGADAFAKGGDGGAVGPKPAVPLAPGVVAVPPVAQPAPGSGGSATATSGAGGNATIPVAGVGGSSGTAVAAGGANGAAFGPAAPAIAAPTPPTGAIGGANSKAVQIGAP